MGPTDQLTIGPGSGCALLGLGLSPLSVLSQTQLATRVTNATSPKLGRGVHVASPVSMTKRQRALFAMNLGPRFVDARHRNLLDLWPDFVDRVKVDHVLRLANTAGVRAGDRVAIHNEAHLTDVDGVDDLAHAHPTVGRV